MKYKYATWRKLYLKEEGAFARLPFTARAYAKQLMLLCDDAGRIDVGDRSLVDVAVSEMGATRSDIRLMKKLFPLLFQVGYLKRIGRYVVIEGFAAAEVGRIRASARAEFQQEVFERDGYRCRYCGTDNDLTLDHVVPIIRGGQNSAENLATACRPCNSSKGDRTPAEWRHS